jgi:pimeloyl-ACP methyl ester carboxylesterase
MTLPSPVAHSYLGLSPCGFHHLSYQEWGEEWGKAARVIVCVHGLTRNARDFDLLAATLSQRLQARIICPDIVGRGDSAWLADPQFYGYPQYLADMNALIARLDVERLDWVGTSMGGLIGMQLAAQPHSPIRKLVINDVGPFIPKQALERIASYVGQAPPLPNQAAVMRYLQDKMASFGNLSPAQWEHLARHGASLQPDGSYRLAYDPAIATIFSGAAIADVDLWPLWAALRQPTLLLRGAQSDLLLEETALRMTQEGPKARLHTVADAGHAPALMADDQIGAIGDFLFD